MQALALLENPHDRSQPGVVVEYNRPDFAAEQVSGGLQISVIATSPDSGPAFESPHFRGATIQTRNLIELLSGSIPLDDDGKPLSVLGPLPLRIVSMSDGIGCCAGRWRRIPADGRPRHWPSPASCRRSNKNSRSP